MAIFQTTCACCSRLFNCLVSTPGGSLCTECLLDMQRLEKETRHLSDDIYPEVLIDDLKKENEKLKEELEQAQIDIKEFERLAIEWKQGYYDLLHRSSVKIQHLEQTIEDIEKMKEFK